MSGCRTSLGFMQREDHTMDEQSISADDFMGASVDTHSVKSNYHRTAVVRPSTQCMSTRDFLVRPSTQCISTRDCAN